MIDLEDDFGRVLGDLAASGALVRMDAISFLRQAMCYRHSLDSIEGGRVMTIPISSLKKRWIKEPGFKKGYDALAGEYALASMLIDARTKAKLPQAKLAERMGTSQSTIARLESGAAKPILSTLERFAKATGTRVRVSLEPAKRARKPRQAA
jgi:DNA-binding XRE family transcriptional regulator